MFGDFLNPEPTVAATPDPDLKGQWDAWLQKPEVRAGLLSFGLQAMTGGWGGIGQQFAQAAGSGLEAYAGTQKLQEDKELAARTRADSLAEKEKDRQLRRDLNSEDNAAAMARSKFSAGANREAARDQAFWDRAVAQRSAQLQRENTAKLKQYEEMKTFAPDTPPPELLDDTQIMEDATSFADGLAQRRGARTGRAVSGQKNEANKAGSALPKGDMPAGEMPATEPPSDAVIKDAPVSESKEYDLTDPKNQKLWNDPATRKVFESKGYVKSGNKVVKGGPDGMPAGAQLINEGLLFKQYRLPDGTVKAVSKSTTNVRGNDLILGE